MHEKTDHDILVAIHTILLGTDGHEGLCKKVQRHGVRISRLEIAVVAIVSTGILGVGITELVKALMR